MNTRALILPILGLLCGAVSACDEGVTVPVVKEELQVVVVSAEEHKKFLTAKADGTQAIATVEVEIRNDVPQRVVLGLSAFKVRMNDGSLLAPDVLLSAGPNGCAHTTVLGQGGTVRCTLGLVYKPGPVPQTLMFHTVSMDNPLAIQVDVPFQFQSCTWCSGECVKNFDRNPRHCGACGFGVPAYASCVDGQETCHDGYTMCSGECLEGAASCP